MARGRRGRKGRGQPTWFTVGVALCLLCLVVFGHPAYVWLTVRAPDDDRRAAAIAALAAQFPISAIDDRGTEWRVRRHEMTSVEHGPCRRDLSLDAPSGLLRQGLIFGRMTIFCLDVLQHPEHGRLRTVIRYDHDRGDRILRPEAQGGAGLVAEAARLER